jgi:hypothetical protein
MRKNEGKSAVRTAMRLMAPALVAFAFFGCQPSNPEMDLFSEDFLIQRCKIDISNCPEKVKKTIYKDKDLSAFFAKGALPCSSVIYRMDTDQNGVAEYVCFFTCPNGKSYYLILNGEGGAVIAKGGWLEMNKPLLQFVSSIKKGEYEILIKHPGGGSGFETADITLYKIQGNAFRRLFTGDYFWHEWRVGEKDKFKAKYYSLAGIEPPFEIRQYEGELTRNYATMQKNPPNFVTQKSGGRVLKVFRWDPDKFAFVEKK